MLFQKKYERARDTQLHASGLDQEEERKRREQQPEEKLEKGDWFAMLFSAFYTLFLPAIGILGLMVLIAYLVFGLF